MRNVKSRSATQATGLVSPMNTQRALCATVARYALGTAFDLLTQGFRRYPEILTSDSARKRPPTEVPHRRQSADHGRPDPFESSISISIAKGHD